MGGKSVRLARLLPDGRSVVVAADHGIAFGPLRGVEDLSRVAEAAASGGADGLMVNLGALRRLEPRGLSLVASLPCRRRIDPWAAVAEALRAGADAVKLMVFTNCPEEDDYVDLLAETALACEEWELPLMAEMYPREGRDDPEVVARAARIAFETGADLVKTFYVEGFSRVVEGCPLPILILGGPRAESDLDLLRVVESAVSEGAAGVAFGRNVWQRDDPASFVRALRAVVHESAGAEEAVEIVGG